MLSPRQTEIAELVAQGLSDKEIGNRLHMTEGTVGQHLNKIYLKWHIHSRTGLAVRFLQEEPPYSVSRVTVPLTNVSLKNSDISGKMT
jgi:DNA-binding NarL/FixJ family response regulator